MSRVRLVAADLDGTLVGPDRQLDAGMRRAVGHLRGRRILLIIATGRMFCSARRYAEELGNADTPLIAYNGAWVAVPASGEVLYRRSLSGELARRLLRRLAGYHLQAYQDDQLFVRELNERAREYALTFRVQARVADLEDLAPAGFSKLQVIDTPEIIARLLGELRGEGWEATVTRSSGVFLEIMAPGVSKGEALADLLKRWRIAPGQVLAAGDGDNDLPLFRLAGQSVAMAEGSQAARTAAGQVLPREELAAFLAVL
ncbi:MAG: HAD family hydrolase [Thermaerobacter sp.]|nr:HAD family hydrolase [Thermaerobacter sp.]